MVATCPPTPLPRMALWLALEAGLRPASPPRAAVVVFVAVNAIIYFTMFAAAVCVRLEKIVQELIWLL